jgi:hypothetical protein
MMTQEHKDRAARHGGAGNRVAALGVRAAAVAEHAGELQPWQWDRVSATVAMLSALLASRNAA